MRAYITGSRAYGTPREDSDIDLVIACGTSDLFALWAVVEHTKLMFGRLNLVAFNVDIPEEAARYERWLSVHNSLVARRPVTKEEAIAAFREADAESAYLEKDSDARLQK